MDPAKIDLDFSTTCFDALERYIKRFFFHGILPYFITLILIIDQFKFQINNLCM